MQLSRERAAAKAAAHLEMERLAREEESFGSTGQKFDFGDQKSRRAAGRPSAAAD